MARVTFTDHFGDAEAAATAGAGRGMVLATEHLLAESRALAPIEEGTLERSGVASQDGLRGAVSYDTVYAARQHEELTWRHDAGRQAKYLEQPLHTGAEDRNALIAAEIRRELRS